MQGRITIKARTSDVDDVGGVTRSWPTHHVCWAEVTFLSGEEFNEAKERAGQVDVRFSVRASSETAPVDQQYRVVYEGVTYDIVYVIPEPGARPKVYHLYGRGRQDG